MEPVILHTPRLVLSRPIPADVDAITAAAQDPDVPRWTTLPSPYTRRDAEEFVAKVARSWQEGTELVWAIRRDAAWVGSIGLHRIQQHTGSAELGYWLAAPVRGQGLLTEAARAVLDLGFAADGLDLMRIEWKAVAGNLPSARAARRLGFRYEGTVRQALVDPRGRHDGWIAAILRDDDRMPQPWPVLDD